MFRTKLLKSIQIVISNPGRLAAGNIPHLRPILPCPHERDAVQSTGFLYRLKLMDSLTKFFHQMPCVLARRPIKGKTSVLFYQDSRIWALVFRKLLRPMKVSVFCNVLRNSLSNVVGDAFGFEKDIIYRLSCRLLTVHGCGMDPTRC